MASNESERNLISRRNVLRGGVFGGAALVAMPLLAACGGAQQSAQPTTAPKPTAAAPTSAPTPAAKPTEAGKSAAATAKPKAAADKQLIAMYWSDSPADANVWVQTFKAFENRNPGIKIQFDDTPSANFVQKLTTLTVGGTPPDFHLTHAQWVMQLINSKTLTDVTDRLKADKELQADYFPQQLEYWTEKGRLYCLPYYSGLSCIFYNKDIFKEKGVKTPDEYEKEGKWDWETFRQVAKDTSGGTGATKTIGFDGANGNPWNLQYYTCVPVWSQGGELINEEQTEWLVDSDPVVEAIQYHADMALKDKSLAGQADVQGTTQIFWTGRVAMAFGIKAHTVSIPTDKMNVGHAPVPKGKAGRINRDGPNATGIPSAGKNIDVAYEVAKFIASPESPYLGSGRSFPVRKSLLDSDMYKKALKPYENPAIWAEAAATLRAWRMPGKGAEIARVFKEAGDRVLVGQLSARDAMKQVKPEMDALLK